MTPTDVKDATVRLVGSDRVLAVLTHLATLPTGGTLDDIVRMTGDPRPTVHRALAALVRAGLADNDRRGHYILGDEFLRLAFAHHEARPDSPQIHSLLQHLAERFGETAHYAVLDDRSVIYRAKVDPIAGGIRLTSTIGGRNPAHATAVGKVLLAPSLLTLRDVEQWVGDAPLERRTEYTVATAEELHRSLVETRRRGYAVDDQESEAGVNCIAFPVFLASPAEPSGAISVSAVSYRTPLADLVAAVDEIRGMLGQYRPRIGAVG